jgi:hypothetical protein
MKVQFLVKNKVQMTIISFNYLPLKPGNLVGKTHIYASWIPAGFVERFLWTIYSHIRNV